MSYETCESAGEKTIELDQDNRKNGGEGRGEGQTKEPLRKLGGDQLDPASPRGASTAHESNAPRPILCLIIHRRPLPGKKPKHIPEIKLSLVIGQN